MASSASLFHHQDSCRHRLSCALTPYFVCNKPVLSFDQISSEVVAVSVNTVEDFLELAARLRISELPYFQTRRAWVAQGRFDLDLDRISFIMLHTRLMLQSNLLSRNNFHIHNMGPGLGLISQPLDLQSGTLLTALCDPVYVFVIGTCTAYVAIPITS